MRDMHRRVTVCLLLILGLAVTGCGRQSAGAASPDISTATPTQPPNGGGALSCSLEAPRVVESGVTVPVSFGLTNTGTDDVYLLTWFTPLEGIANEIFRVQYGEETLAYEGILVMRGDPQAEEYVFLASGTSISTTVDLATSYDVSRTGDYVIELMPPRQSHLTTREGEIPAAIDALGKVSIACNTLTLTISGSSSADPGPAEDGAGLGNGVVITLSGTVASASPSARIVTLEVPVEGISTVALLDDTEVRSSEGAPLTFKELQPGTQIEVLGRPGDSDALLAIEVRVLDAIAPDAGAPMGNSVARC